MSPDTAHILSVCLSLCLSLCLSQCVSAFIFFLMFMFPCSWTLSAVCACIVCLSSDNESLCLHQIINEASLHLWPSAIRHALMDSSSSSSLIGQQQLCSNQRASECLSLQRRA